MARKNFTDKTLEDRFAFAGGRCEWIDRETNIRCYAVLKPGGWHGDHDLPDRMGGKNDFDNCRCLCLHHHAIKTAEIDAPRIAKTRRQSAMSLPRQSKLRGPGFHKAPPQRRATGAVVKWKGY